MSEDFLHLHAWLPGVHNILGPGRRAVVWVQGCSLKCPGCMVPETWSTEGGYNIDIERLAGDIIKQTDVEGVTISGGEPTEQPEAVAKLLTLVKNAGKNTWVYSGYTFEELVAKNDPAIDRLLSLTDVLVDGRYDRERAGTYNYRGSANQRIVYLSEKIKRIKEGDCEASRVEIRLDESGQMVVLGIPPPGFLKNFKEELNVRGIAVSNKSSWL